MAEDIKTPFKEAKKQLSELEKAVRSAEREEAAEYELSSERDEYMRDRRRKERLQKLDSIVPDRVCPSCRRVFPHTLSWVITDKSAKCRSCNATQKTGERAVLKKSEVLEEIVSKVYRRFEISGESLKTLREECEIPLRDFAETAGWSRAYQHKLEHGDQQISEDTLDTILQTFDRLLNRR